MKKFVRRIFLLVAIVMMLSMGTLMMPASANSNAKMIWDFKDATTEDIAEWENQLIFFAYEPWSTSDLEIVDGKLVMHHMKQETQCNSLDLMINKNEEDYSAYKSIALWVDTTAVERAYTVKLSIIDKAKNNISISIDKPYTLYPDNGVKEERITGGDPRWIFLSLPPQFKGYIEMPFDSMKVMNWNEANVKDIDKDILSQEFRLLLEFNNSVDGEVVKIDDVQLIKSGNPINWVEGTASSSVAPTSSNPPASEAPSSEPPVESEPADESDPADVSDASGDATGSDEASEPDESDESTTTSDESKDPSEDPEKDGNTALIVALIIAGVAVVAGGGFAIYKFVLKK